MKKVNHNPLSEERFPLVIENILYTRRIARQFYADRVHFGFDVQDFEGAAMLGLCDAARRYNPEKCQHFRTFAYFRIRGAMYDLLRRGGGVNRKYFKLLIEKDRPTESKRQPEGNPPFSPDSEKTNESSGKEIDPAEVPFAFARTVDELAGMLDVIDELNLRLHVSVDDGSAELAYSEDLNPEQLTMLRSSKQHLRKLISQLPEDQRLLIELRYYEGQAFEEIRSSLGFPSKSHVARIHQRALDNLKTLILNQVEA